VLVIKDKKTLVLKVKNPAKITTVIPTAKTFNYKGTELVAVPHKIDEVKILNNMGFGAPSPIKYYYPFPGKFTPFFAQLETSEFLTLSPRSFCLNDLGTGKTMASLWAYDYLRQHGKVKKALVVSPLSTLERTWADEIFRNFTHLNSSVLYGSRARRLKLLADPDIDIYLINHHGVKIIADDLKDRDDIDLIIIDEIAQAGRNSGTDIWKSLNAVCNKQQGGKRRVWGLTGTPTPNAPTDAWAQCRLIVPSNVPPYFKRFKESVMRQVGPFQWLPRANAVEVVKEAMQPAIRFTRDQCVDLPECVYQTRQVDLTDNQKRAYKEMLNTLKTEAAGGQILAVNEAVKMSKLVQIACGVAYDSKGEEVSIPATPRLEVVKEIISDAATKTIVFVPFVSSVSAVAEYLRKEGFSVECIHGGVSMNERSRIFALFQKHTEPQVLVAQPAAMSHGLTLTAANTIVWYAPITSNETYEQANGRITRPGQKHSQLIVNIEGTPIEKKIYERLQQKTQMQGLLLDMVQDDT
jgi:SNF2 family DNA or RNA helicase